MFLDVIRDNFRLNSNINLDPKQLSPHNLGQIATIITVRSDTMPKIHYQIIYPRNSLQMALSPQSRQSFTMATHQRS